MSVIGLLVLAAFVATIASALGRVPLWIAVLLIVIVQLLGVLPLR